MIALNINLEIWPTPPLIFTQGVKKCKIWPLRRCGFETKQRKYIWESKRVMSDCTHPPDFCVAVDPQTTNGHRTIVAPRPPSS